MWHLNIWGGNKKMAIEKLKINYKAQ